MKSRFGALNARGTARPSAVPSAALVVDDSPVRLAKSIGPSTVKGHQRQPLYSSSSSASDDSFGDAPCAVIADARVTMLRARASILENHELRGLIDPTLFSTTPPRGASDRSGTARRTAVPFAILAPASESDEDDGSDGSHSDTINRLGAPASSIPPGAARSGAASSMPACSTATFTLMAQFPDGRSIAFPIVPSAPLSALHVGVAASAGVPPSAVRITFDGNPVPLGATADRLGMECGDVVDVVIADK